MTTRRALTSPQKVRIFDRHKGICHWCELKIHVGQKWEADHVIPIWAGGSDTSENMAPIHLDPCHREKTGAEATDRAKELRVRANHLGIEKPGPKLPAGRNSGIRKKINGEVISRPARGSDHKRVMEKLYPWGIPE